MVAAIPSERRAGTGSRTVVANFFRGVSLLPRTPAGAGAAARINRFCKSVARRGRVTSARQLGGVFPRLTRLTRSREQAAGLDLHARPHCRRDSDPVDE